MAAAAVARTLAAAVRSGRVADAARAGRVAFSTTSRAGAKDWSNANQLADELAKLVEKTPTETELVKLRQLSKELLQILEAPLTEGMTIQELKYYMLEKDVQKLRAGTDFHHNLSFALYGVFGCYVLTLSSGIFNLHLQAKTGKGKMTEDHKKLRKEIHALKSRLAHVEAKVDLIRPEEVDEDDAAPETKESGGWLGSWKKWFHAAGGDEQTSK